MVSADIIYFKDCLVEKQNASGKIQIKIRLKYKIQNHSAIQGIAYSQVSPRELKETFTYRYMCVGLWP